MTKTVKPIANSYKVTINGNVLGVSKADYNKFMKSKKTPKYQLVKNSLLNRYWNETRANISELYRGLNTLKNVMNSTMRTGKIRTIRTSRTSKS